MNSTRWPSLTEFAKYLSRQGICRVDETDKGLHIAWIDNSPEALRRQEALRKKEQMNKDDEEREQRLIKEQVRRAQETVKVDDEASEEARELQRVDGEKIVLNFGSKATIAKPPSPAPLPPEGESASAEDDAAPPDTVNDVEPPVVPSEQAASTAKSSASNVMLAFGSVSNKPKNVFASKKNPLAAKKAIQIEQPKKMSEAERIMREEMERKRSRDSNGHAGLNKRQRVA